MCKILRMVPGFWKTINEMVVVVVFVKICVKSKRKALSSARNIYMRIKIKGHIAGKERMNETKFSPT